MSLFIRGTALLSVAQLFFNEDELAPFNLRGKSKLYEGWVSR